MRTAIIVLAFLSVLPAVLSRSFVISSDGKMFLRDGQPFRILAGEMHPPRIMPTQWQDRLHKLRMSGLNTVQVYVMWNWYEPRSGQFRWDGAYDLERFMRLAQQEDLLVILRTGPYICGEWDWGGLPTWIREEYPNANIRRMDKDYIAAVDRWYGELLPRMKPLLYSEGGPIVSAQVENEYGSYGADKEYLAHLRDLLRKYLGNDVIVHSTDGNSDGMMKNTFIPGVYQTVDFGVGGDPKSSFALQHKYSLVKGPNYNTEFYPGWLTHWGEAHMQRVDKEKVATALDNMLKIDNYTSVSFYMFHGGTNWGFWAGANGDDSLSFTPHVTSYDYDAPLSEAGDPTDKYFAVQNILRKYTTIPPGPQPVVGPKDAYGPFAMNDQVSLFDVMFIMSPGAPTVAEQPMTFEQLKFPFGIVVYDTVIDASVKAGIHELKFGKLHDRAYIFLQNKMVGVIQRPGKSALVTIPDSPRPLTLRVIVEHQARINYGASMDFDVKGIIAPATLGSQTLTNWTMQTVAFEPKQILQLHPRYRNRYSNDGPAFFHVDFDVPTSPPHDTWLQLNGWGKGIAFLNGFNLGRYWPEVGPQHTLYVPADLLKQTNNDLTLFEFEKAGASISFVTKGPE